MRRRRVLFRLLRGRLSVEQRHGNDGIILYRSGDNCGHRAWALKKKITGHTRARASRRQVITALGAYGGNTIRTIKR